MEKRNKKKEEGLLLRSYLRSLSVDQSPKMRTLIAEKCGVKKQTINNWCGGLAKIPFLAKEKIEEVAGLKIFNSENE